MKAAVPYFSLGLRRAYQTHSALWHVHVGPTLSSVQYGVLYFLNEHGDLGQRELMDLAELDKSSLAELLHRMEQQGTVATRRDPDDKRRKIVAITPEGLRRFAEVRPIAQDVNRLLTERFTADEETQFAQLLAKVASPPLAE